MIQVDEGAGADPAHDPAHAGPLLHSTPPAHPARPAPSPRQPGGGGGDRASPAAGRGGGGGGGGAAAAAAAEPAPGFYLKDESVTDSLASRGSARAAIRPPIYIINLYTFIM
jgi:hypothetical protein